MSVQLEVGKRYVRRDGVVTGEMALMPDKHWPFYDPLHVKAYNRDGVYAYDGPRTVFNITHAFDADYDHLGDLQREYNETQEKLAATMRCNVRMFGESDDDKRRPNLLYWERRLGIKRPQPDDNTAREAKEQACWEVAENQAMGLYDPPQPAIRTFASGATRNLDHNKLDYEGFNCPAAQRSFAEYMHTHRKQADGTMRDGDNWQKGIPIDQYMKSIKRHTQDLHLLHRGWSFTRPEDGIDLLPTTENKIELLCAIWFNVQGMIHELLKATKSPA